MSGVSLLVAGCTVGPDFTAPSAPENKAYEKKPLPELTVLDKNETEQHIALGKKISGDWWHLLRSSQLDQVLQQAIAGNLTLVAAQASLNQAREAVNQAAGANYPQLDFAGTAARQKLNFANSGLKGFPPAIFNFYSLGPTLNYALDVFGGIKRQIEQQQALAQFQDYQVDAAYLTLTGNAVSQSLVIASARAQIKAVESIIADDERNLELVRREYREGVIGQPDVELAASQLASDRIQLPPLRQQLDVARHALAILVGKSPADFTPPDFDLTDLTLPEELPVSLPSELVHQRPDLLAAEAQLHAASAEVGVATAQLYPNVTLTASMAQAVMTPGEFFNPMNNVWSFGAGLTAPLFHGGELEAQRRGAIAAFRGSLANYQQTVLQSFGQVADLLQGLAHDAESLNDERLALDAAESSLRLTRIAFSAGTVSTLQIIDAERLYEQALLGYTRAQAQRYIDTAQLFVAMGGGWWDWRGRQEGRPAAQAQAQAASG